MTLNLLLDLKTFKRPNIWWRVQITKLTITQISPSSCHFLTLKSKHSVQHLVLRHLRSMFFHHVRDKVSRPHKSYDYSFVYFYFTFSKCKKQNFNTFFFLIRNCLFTFAKYMPRQTDRENWEPHLLTDLFVHIVLYACLSKVQEWWRMTKKIMRCES